MQSKSWQKFNFVNFVSEISSLTFLKILVKLCDRFSDFPKMCADFTAKIFAWINFGTRISQFQFIYRRDFTSCLLFLFLLVIAIESRHVRSLLASRTAGCIGNRYSGAGSTSITRAAKCSWRRARVEWTMNARNNIWAQRPVSLTIGIQCICSLNRRPTQWTWDLNCFATVRVMINCHVVIGRVAHSYWEESSKIYRQLYLRTGLESREARSISKSELIRWIVWIIAGSRSSLPLCSRVPLRCWMYVCEPVALWQCSNS